MNDVKKRLAEEKGRLEAMTAPDELEMRLRRVLDNTKSKRSYRIAPVWKVAAVILFFLIVCSYHFDALAFYSKKLLGFDDVMTGTLQELNEAEMGQSIEKKLQLGTGTFLTVNGIMTDANRLIMYYTLSNPDGVDLNQNLFNPEKISGFLTNSNVESSNSTINEAQTEIKGTINFEPVNPFAKKLTLHFWDEQKNGQINEASLTFPYHPNKAMQEEIKQSIKKTVKVDKGIITFNSISATPTLTVINGLLNVANLDRSHLQFDRVELVANGTLVEQMGSGSRTSFGRTTFDISYDALPKQLESLELVVREFVGYQELHQTITLPTNDEMPINLNGKELWVKAVSTTEEEVKITIVTYDDIMLEGVSIETINGKTPLNTTMNEVYENQDDGKVLKERTLLFDTNEEPTSLLIEGIHYMKAYNETIEIPIGK